MTYKAYETFLSENSITALKYEPLSSHTTFRIGGPCDIWVAPDTEEKLIGAIREAKRMSLPAYILGRGSNVLFDDSGYRGVVISTEKLNTCSVDRSEVHCSCGASFTAVSAAARDAGLSGLEFAYGIPGAVGGAVYMNAGAYGGEVANVLKESTYYDASDDCIVTIPLAEHCYGYRESVYKHFPERIILSASFSLTPGSVDDIRNKMNEHMESRRSKQPLEYPSAGSVFKRATGHYTGQMIEELGLKGFSVGGAQISEKHAGFIINKGGATCNDVLQLVEIIREKVQKEYGVMLETELIYVK